MSKQLSKKDLDKPRSYIFDGMEYGSLRAAMLAVWNKGMSRATIIDKQTREEIIIEGDIWKL